MQIDDVRKRDEDEAAGAEAAPDAERRRRGAVVRPDDLLDVADMDPFESTRKPSQCSRRYASVQHVEG